jgi:hypothetical protein
MSNILVFERLTDFQKFLKETKTIGYKKIANDIWGVFKEDLKNRIHIPDIQYLIHE